MILDPYLSLVLELNSSLRWLLIDSKRTFKGSSTRISIALSRRDLFRIALPGLLNICISVTSPRDHSSCSGLILRRQLTPLSIHPFWRFLSIKAFPANGEFGCSSCWIVVLHLCCSMVSLEDSLNA